MNKATDKTATERPWQIETPDGWGDGFYLVTGPKGTHVTDFVAKPNAEFIVRAVNAHDDLLAVLKKCGDMLGFNDPQDHAFESDLAGEWRAAVAKAEGRDA